MYCSAGPDGIAPSFTSVPATSAAAASDTDVSSVALEKLELSSTSIAILSEVKSAKVVTTPTFTRIGSPGPMSRAAPRLM